MSKLDELIAAFATDEHSAAGIRKAYELGKADGAKRTSSVKCMTTGQVFPTSRKAAAFANISPATLSQHLNNPSRYPTAGGYTFQKV